MPECKMFHLAWFTNARPHGWIPGGGADPWAGSDVEQRSWASGEFLMDMCRAMERACFDYIMLEDHVATPATEHMEARLDPLPLLPLLGHVTSRLGVVATLSTSFWPPYLLARMTATVDQLTNGRSGWNVVTTSEDYAAQAFGLGDKQPPHDERYVRAEEFVELVKKLWDGWDEGSVIMDRSTGRYVDRAKVHDFDFEGKYFKGKGPLNVARSPQGRPVICQAGGSPTGREFSAKHADTVLLSSDGANSIQVLKDFRDDLRARAAANGRNPDDIKVLYMVTPVVADTDEQAEAIFTKRFTLTEAKVQSFVKGIGSYFSIDFTKYDLDKPLPIEEMRTEGHQTTLENFLRHADGGRRTFREMIARFRPTSLDLVGSLETVADKMEAAMAEIGGDGFLIQSRPLTRRYITEITEGLVPVLQRRGLTRSSYKHNYLREHLLEF